MIEPEKLRIDIEWDEAKSGQKIGYPPSWIIITHLPTQTQIRLYGGSESQHRTRMKAVALMELALDEMPADECRHPEIFTEQGH